MADADPQVRRLAVMATKQWKDDPSYIVRYDALKAATVNPAKALNLDVGTIEAGKLADLIMIDGDPLADVANLHKVKRVIVNGRVYELDQLLRGTAAAKTTSSQAR